MFLASELATFPVCASSLSPIKEIIKIARDLDSLLLKKKRATQAQGWRDKVAKDMDMIIDDDDVYPFFKSILVFLLIFFVCGLQREAILILIS